VLDIGCGYGRNAFLIREYCYEHNLVPVIIGIDLDKSYLSRSKYHRVYDHLILANACNLPIKHDSIDIVILVEVLEHLPKKKALFLLQELDSILKVRGMSIITTPHGFQKSPDNPIHGYNVHRSAWYKRELINLGYTVLMTLWS